MTYEAFLTLCHGALTPDQFDEVLPDFRSWRNPTREDPNGPYLIVEWETGGHSGGSCYGGSAQRYSTDNQPSELESLDTLLVALKPNLGFIQYKRLVAEIVKQGHYGVPEYYGNSTEYAYKAVSLRSLYTFMLAEDWLPE